MKTATTERQAVALFCSGCGSKLLGGALYCCTCGAPISGPGPNARSSEQAVSHGAPQSLPRHVRYVLGPITVLVGGAIIVDASLRLIQGLQGRMTGGALAGFAIVGLGLVLMGFALVRSGLRKIRDVPEKRRPRAVLFITGLFGVAVGLGLVGWVLFNLFVEMQDAAKGMNPTLPFLIGTGCALEGMDRLNRAARRTSVPSQAEQRLNRAS